MPDSVEGWQPPDKSSTLPEDEKSSPQKNGEKAPSADQETKPATATTEALWQLIAAPLKVGSGFRVLFLGDSGLGKTFANRLFIAWLLRNKGVDIVLTLDTKNANKAEYPGACERVNPADLRKRPPGYVEPRNHINFRGVAATRRLSEDCSPDEVARLAWELVTKKPLRVVLNIDELSDATNGAQGWKDKLVAATYRKGRGPGISVTATTQLPQTLPREAFGLSEVILMFRMSGREAAYLVRQKSITPESAEIVPTLVQGQCLIYDKNKGGLDGSIVNIGK